MEINWSSQQIKAPSLCSQFFSEPVKVESAYLGRQSLECSGYPLDVLPSLLVRLQISIAIHVSSSRVTGFEVPEEDIDSDTDVFLWRSSMQPQRRDKQHIAWPKIGLLRVGMGQRGRHSIVHIEDVDTGARRTRRDVKVLDIAWRIKHEFLGAAYLTENVGHDLEGTSVLATVHFSSLVPYIVVQPHCYRSRYSEWRAVSVLDYLL